MIKTSELMTKPINFVILEVDLEYKSMSGKLGGTVLDKIKEVKEIKS